MFTTPQLSENNWEKITSHIADDKLQNVSSLILGDFLYNFSWVSPYVYDKNSCLVRVKQTIIYSNHDPDLRLMPYNGVTWASWRLKSATRLLVQHIMLS